MENDFYYIELFEIYEGLLTENQRNAFYSHFCLDLSLAETAETTGTGRQNVYETVKKVKNKLDEYEKVLGLREKFGKIKELAARSGNEKLAEQLISVIGV